MTKRFRPRPTVKAFYKRAVRLPYGTTLDNGFYMLPEGWKFRHKAQSLSYGDAPFVWWTMLPNVRTVRWDE